MQAYFFSLQRKLRSFKFFVFRIENLLYSAILSFAYVSFRPATFSTPHTLQPLFQCNIWHRPRGVVQLLGLQDLPPCPYAEEGSNNNNSFGVHSMVGFCRLMSFFYSLEKYTIYRWFLIWKKCCPGPPSQAGYNAFQSHIKIRFSYLFFPLFLTPNCWFGARLPLFTRFQDRFIRDSYHQASREES